MLITKDQEFFGILQRIHDRLEQLDRRMDRIETIVMVREPQTPVAAEAYEGLRKQVVNSASSRMAHLSQLMQWHAAIVQNAAPQDLTEMLGSWFQQAGLQLVTDADLPEPERYFEFIDDRTGGPVEVLEPAYVDGVTGRVVRPGRARRLSRSRLMPEGGAA